MSEYVPAKIIYEMYFENLQNDTIFILFVK